MIVARTTTSFQRFREESWGGGEGDRKAETKKWEKDQRAFILAMTK